MVSPEVLKNFGLFKGLDDAGLAKIAELCAVRPMSEGEHIFKEGTRATHLHLCHSGKVDIVIWVPEPWNRDMVVHTGEPGELFGWSALVAPYTYTASAQCVEAGEEIRIKGPELLDLFDQNPNVGHVILKNLSADVSARLTQTRRRLCREWLNSWQSIGSTSWGEPGRR